MKKRTIRLIAGSLIISALLMISCTPAPPGEEETVTPEEEVVPAEEEVVTEEQGYGFGKVERNGGVY